jgi:hypothetical protein
MWRTARTPLKKKPIWQIAAEIAAEIPDEECDKVPHDGSINYKHYLYGNPKQPVEPASRAS